MKTILTAAALGFGLTLSAKASIIFEDFNLSEGHYNQAPTFSGSTVGYATGSTADLITTGGALEGAGFERLNMIWNTTTTTTTRIRFLSGGGTPANNTAFATSAGVDGWIGFYVRTTDPGWTVQPYLEGPESNGGIPKTLINDGQWHLYEWNLDDETGGANGWGAIAGIVAGDADFQAGSYTFDSIVFRDTTPSDAVLDFDFLAKSDAGSVSALVPEPSSVVLGLMGGVATLLAIRRRR